MANIPVDSTAFSAFDMQELSAATFDAGLFFYRGKRPGKATGWHGLSQFEAAVAAAREKIRTFEANGRVGPAK
jgi:hypothetical protein